MSDSIQSKGGHARAASMTGAERTSVASQAARARWAKQRSTLSIPVGDRVVMIPVPLTEEDYSLLLDTLKLWKKKIVK